MKKSDKIIVVDYDSNWSKQFEELKSVLIQHLKNDRIKIEHVGSTSIQGLKAKPIIDLDIIIEEDPILMDEIIARLNELGYRHVGDLGVTGREAFKKVSAKTPDTGIGKDWFKHHLYLCKEGSIGLRNHLLFRDYLNTHPEEISKYGQLKQELTKKYPYDIDSYIDGKTDFITAILKKAGMKEKDAEQIDNENRLK